MTTMQISTKNGDLTADELKELMQCINEMNYGMWKDSGNRQINLFMLAPNITLKELEDVIDPLKPFGFKLKALLKDGMHG